MEYFLTLCIVLLLPDFYSLKLLTKTLNDPEFKGLTGVGSLLNKVSSCFMTYIVKAFNVFFIIHSIGNARKYTKQLDIRHVDGITHR
jgi:hypothetical protein